MAHDVKELQSLLHTKERLLSYAFSVQCLSIGDSRITAVCGRCLERLVYLSVRFQPKPSKLLMFCFMIDTKALSTASNVLCVLRAPPPLPICPQFASLHTPCPYKHSNHNTFRQDAALAHPKMDPFTAESGGWERRIHKLVSLCTLFILHRRFFASFNL